MSEQTNGTEYVSALEGIAVPPYVRVERETVMGDRSVRTLVEVNPDTGSDIEKMVAAVAAAVKSLSDSDGLVTCRSSPLT